MYKQTHHGEVTSHFDAENPNFYPHIGYEPSGNSTQLIVVTVAIQCVDVPNSGTVIE